MLNAYLTIVKCPLYGHIVDIPVQDSGHLGLLNRADTAFWIQDEH